MTGCRSHSCPSRRIYRIYLTNLRRGNIVIIGSTVSMLVALTYGGLQFAWTSWHVLLPIIVGALGLCFFFVYEAKWAKEPTVSRNQSITLAGLTQQCHDRYPSSVLPTGPFSAGKNPCFTWSINQNGVKADIIVPQRYLGTFFHGIISIAAICKHTSLLCDD